MVCDPTNHSNVLAGCIVKDLEAKAGPAVELCLMAVKSEAQSKGLGRRMVDALKQEYPKIVTFAD